MLSGSTSILNSLSARISFTLYFRATCGSVVTPKDKLNYLITEEAGNIVQRYQTLIKNYNYYNDGEKLSLIFELKQLPVQQAARKYQLDLNQLNFLRRENI